MGVTYLKMVNQNALQWINVIKLFVNMNVVQIYMNVPIMQKFVHHQTGNFGYF